MDLRTQPDAIQVRSAAFDARSAELEARLTRMKRDAGLSAVSGAGVLVTLDDGRVAASTPKREIERAIVHSTDITDVLNAAWKAGAEAISVNGERITAASACVGAVIQINGTLLSPPFVFNIVGPSDQPDASRHRRSFSRIPAAVAQQSGRARPIRRLR